jgi:hypothetical protein
MKKIKLLYSALLIFFFLISFASAKCEFGKKLSDNKNKTNAILKNSIKISDTYSISVFRTKEICNNEIIEDHFITEYHFINKELVLIKTINLKPEKINSDNVSSLFKYAKKNYTFNLHKDELRFFNNIKTWNFNGDVVIYRNTLNEFDFHNEELVFTHEKFRDQISKIINSDEINLNR